MIESVRCFCLEVTGDFACFTRPENKVERVSYPFITPSAARSVFEAIYWHPPIRWSVNKIEILSPIRWFNITRNEVAARASERGKCIYVEDSRQVKSARILRDVAYRLHAAMTYCPPDGWIESGDEGIAKYSHIFALRAERGRYYTYPYLGCREFSVRSVRLVKHPEIEAAHKPPIDVDIDVGYMLYDIDYTDDSRRPMIYCPKVCHGIVEVPSWDSPEVLK